jgi:hypothetical protein
MSYALAEWLASAVIAVAIVAAMYGYYVLKDYLIARYGEAAKVARAEAQRLETASPIQAATSAFIWLTASCHRWHTRAISQPQLEPS